MNNKPALQQGFTLVELLIVVIILSILAAIVIPQFSSATDDAKSASAQSTLANLRSMMDLYYQQHGEYPGEKASNGGTCATGKGTGAAGTTTAMLEQLTRYTDDEGNSCALSDGTYQFGPYYKKDVLAPEPFTNSASVAISSTGNLIMTAAGTDGGYKYDTKAGKIIINHTSYDDL